MAQNSVHKICDDRREGSISEPEVYDIEFPFYWINNTGGGPDEIEGWWRAGTREPKRHELDGGEDPLRYADGPAVRADRAPKRNISLSEAA